MQTLFTEVEQVINGCDLSEINDSQQYFYEDKASATALALNPHKRL